MGDCTDGGVAQVPRAKPPVSVCTRTHTHTHTLIYIHTYTHSFSHNHRPPPVMIAQIIRLYCMKNDLDKAWLVQLALIFTFMFTSLYY